MSGDLKPRIASELEAICREAFGSASGEAAMEWTVIAKGYGFRGGRPSTTSLVRARVPDGCDKGTRARFLRAVGDAWCRVTGAAEDEVIVSARDWSWAG